MGLVFCKKSRQMLPLVAADFVYFSRVFHLVQSCILESSPLPPAFPSHTFLTPLPPFLCSPSLLPFFLLSFPIPSDTLFSPPIPPLLFTLLTLFLLLPLAFQEARELSPAGGLRGSVLPDCQVSFLKNRASDGAACPSQVWC